MQHLQNILREFWVLNPQLEDESVSFWIYKSDDSVLRLQATEEGLTNVKRDLTVYEAYQSVSNAELGR